MLEENVRVSLSSFPSSIVSLAGSPSLPLPPQEHTGISNAAASDCPLKLLYSSRQDSQPHIAGGSSQTSHTPGAGHDSADVTIADVASSAPPTMCIHQELCGLTFRLSPTAFFQVCGRNPNPPWVKSKKHLETGIKGHVKAYSEATTCLESEVTSSAMCVHC